MFCYQCEQTFNGEGCTKRGVCGKSPEVSGLIDLTIHAAKSLSQYANRARLAGLVDSEINRITVDALFSTITNVNFDPERYVKLLKLLHVEKNRAKELYKKACDKSGKKLDDFTELEDWNPNSSLDDLIKYGESLEIPKRINDIGAEITGLHELLMYGIKGAAAYTSHAEILGQEDDNVYAFFHEALDFLSQNPLDKGKLLQLIDKCGKINLRVMELLDQANTSSYGNPIPAKVRVTPIKGKAILVSGHDLKDLEEILKQTEGKGINIYTHGEMLPCHGYPALKKYKHLVGNYGSAWQNQQKEFAAFPGAILMTTNCIQSPREVYSDRIFTCGLVGWPNVKHISDRNFQLVIDAANKAEGFLEDEQEQFITVGFGHNAVLEIADKIVDAVKSKKIRHFFLIGGCDGAKPGRNYYTEFAEQVPKDCVILTLACGKYRFNKKDFGEVNGIPRLIDCGQCNDAFSAIKIVSELAKVFGCGVNDLPCSLILSWYEQKAVAILLTLLHLGIKNMRIGPSLPAFITPPILQVLIDKFNIQLIKDPKTDLQEILGK
ncbi:MAG: hydroxylamine reductase [Deltaproteobacteria bacterium CG07_land_8_20_14_0_80_38_7]|nr:MAG: hydroxylamine reductase [Deltaproteobacteria bacterium CG07_land_8_20_14_0_80_38_7]